MEEDLVGRWLCHWFGVMGSAMLAVFAFGEYQIPKVYQFESSLFL